MGRPLFVCGLPLVSASLCAAQGIVEDYKLTSPGVTRSNVAVGQQFIVVGEENADDFGDFSGAVSVYEIATGAFQYRLTAPAQTEEEFFGGAVAISGSTLLVSAVASSEVQVDGGIVYLFDISTGSSLGSVSPADLQPGDNFGARIAIGDGLALIGSPGDDDNGSSSGSAYVFDVASQAEIRKLVPDDGSLFEQFGNWGIGIHDGIAVLGVPEDDPLGPGSGSAYLFDAVNGQQLRKLVASDGQGFEFFGRSAAIIDGVVAIGVPNDPLPDNAVGSVYRFDALSGAELGVYVQPSPGTLSQLGQSLAAYDGVFVVGADLQFVDGVRTGAAFTFDAATGDHLQRYEPSDIANNFGLGIAIGPAGLAASDLGGVYVYLSDLPCPADLAAPFGVLNFFDISAYIGLYASQSPDADLAAPFGAWNFFDVAAYIGLFNAGCP